VLEYLKAGARRFGSTRTDAFVHAFQELPNHMKASFADYLPPMPGPTATGAASQETSQSGD